jgi:hypothetical protein
MREMIELERDNADYQSGSESTVGRRPSANSSSR